MKHLLVIAVTAFSFTAYAPRLAHAHAEHGQPAYGGVVAEGGQLQGELVVKPAALTLYLTNHGSPVATQGASARLTVLTGTQRSELTLSPAGANRLSLAGAPSLAPGTKAVALVRLADGRSVTLRFELK
jgi:hypothetical protein